MIIEQMLKKKFHRDTDSKYLGEFRYERSKASDIVRSSFMGIIKCKPPFYNLRNERLRILVTSGKREASINGLSIK